MEKKYQKLDNYTILFKVAGTTFRPHTTIETIRNLLLESPQRKITDVVLNPDPTNPYDPNAIEVKVGDLLLGYVPKEDDINQQINKALNFYKIDCLELNLYKTNDQLNDSFIIYLRFATKQK